MLGVVTPGMNEQCHQQLGPLRRWWEGWSVCPPSKASPHDACEGARRVTDNGVSSSLCGRCRAGGLSCVGPTHTLAVPPAAGPASGVRLEIGCARLPWLHPTQEDGHVGQPTPWPLVSSTLRRPDNHGGWETTEAPRVLEIARVSIERGAAPQHRRLALPDVHRPKHEGRSSHGGESTRPHSSALGGTRGAVCPQGPHLCDELGPRVVAHVVEQVQLLEGGAAQQDLRQRGARVDAAPHVLHRQGLQRGLQGNGYTISK